MKKTKYMALVLAAAIMLMGAGYAVWSDQVSIKSTVNTGNFDMQITKATTRTGDNQTQNESHDWHSYDWTHANPVTFTSNEAVVEFNDLYPGGMVQVDMTTENKGTLPAKLKSVNVEFISGNEEVFNLLRAQTSWKADIDGNPNQFDANGKKITQDAWEHVENWKYWRSLPVALEQKLVESTNSRNLVIEPNGWFALGDGSEEGCIKIKLDPSAGNQYQNQSVKFRITFNWEQWATDPNANPYDGTTGYGGDGDL